MLFRLQLLHAFIVGSALSAHFGVDLSVPTNSSTFKCLADEHSVDYAIVRAYRNLGAVDSNAPASIRAAYDAGISALSAYIFPCIPTSPYSIDKGITCKSASEQIADTVSLLAADNIYFAGYSGKPFPSVSRQPRVELSTLWLDVEDEVPSIYYDPDPAVNQAFLQQLVDAMAEASIATGVYTTKTYWGTIMDNVEGYGHFPLWYPRYDGEDSLDFFEPFADFTKCTIKQTGGDVGYCAVSQVDSNYAETNVF